MNRGGVFAISFLIALSTTALAAEVRDSVASHLLASLQAEKLQLTEKGYETNREIALTLYRIHLQAGEEEAALATMDEHLRTDPDDASGWNALGLILLNRNENLLASNAFLYAADMSTGEDRGIYLYNHADAAARLGNEEGARRDLASVSTVENLSVSAQDALVAIRPGSPLPPLKIRHPGRWSASLSVQTGYDSNVILASDNSLTTLARSDAASATGLLVAQAAYQREAWDGDVQGNTSAAFTYNENKSAQAFNSLAFSGAASYGPQPNSSARMSYRYGPRINASFTNPDGLQYFNTSAGVALTPTYKVDSKSFVTFDFPVTYDSYAVSSTTAAADVRSGPTFGMGGTYATLVGAQQLSAGLKYQYLFAQGPNFRGHVITVPLNWSRPFWGNAFVGAGLSGGMTAYSTSGNHRRDLTAVLTGNVGKKLGENWTGTALLLLQRNQSTDPTAQYSKISFSMMVSYDLL